MIVPLVLALLPADFVSAQPAWFDSQYVSTSPIESFDLITPTSGWIQTSQSLHWTENAGDSWLDITPPSAANGRLLAASFADLERGWVLYSSHDVGKADTLALARTSSGGRLWRVIDLRLFPTGGAEVNIEKAFFNFISRNTGWLVLQSATSSNFVDGYLFKTDNGGLTWSRLDIPFGEPVIFINQDTGWTTGGPDGRGFYRSMDGGVTWHPQYVLSQPQQAGVEARYQNPVFTTDRKGFLPLVTNSGSRASIQVYTSQDGGNSWIPNGEQDIQSVDPSLVLPFSIINEEKAVLVHPDTGNIYQVEHSAPDSLSLTSQPALPSILQLDMASATTGWAIQVTGECKNVENGAHTMKKSCTSAQDLLRTRDAGRSWETLSVPAQPVDFSGLTILPVNPPDLARSTPAQTTLSQWNMAITTAGQGIDKCEIPTPDKLQAWIRHSPYDTINLYIGGSARSCSNLALTASYLSQLSQQGWKFIPTWVGPQASCYSRPISRMSSDPLVARQQGIAEADAALEKAYSLGLTTAEKTGAVIYYDLENYDRTNYGCHSAAKAFVEGWSSQLRLRGNSAGVYSLGPILNDFYALLEKPDVIWPAHWKTSDYDPEATVWDVYQLSNSFWDNHQRIRQYAGGHSETWGGISITVDSNVLDGLATSGPIQEDSDDDGLADLFAVHKSGGQTGQVEMYILDGSSNFASILQQHPAALSWANDQWVFDLADYDNDTHPDLLGIHHFATSSGKVEISIVSGASGYQSHLLDTSTGLPQSSPGAWVYQFGNYDQDGIPDLFAIDRQGYSNIYVKVLSGASAYQSQVASLPTALPNSGSSGAWAYAIADFDLDHVADLVAINKSLGASGKTEVIVLSGADNFQSSLLNIPTGLSKSGSDNSWAFFLRDHNRDSRPDLFAVSKSVGLQGKTALYVLDGAAQYSTFLLGVPTALPLTGSDCSWDFFTGQCYTSNPNLQFRYFFPLAYR